MDVSAPPASPPGRSGMVLISHTITANFPANGPAHQTTLFAKLVEKGGGGEGMDF